MRLNDELIHKGFKDPKKIKLLQKNIEKLAEKLNRNINIMEVCGGHTHTIAKYGLNQITPKNINFIHGPGCPVCVMPKDRIDKAIILGKQKDVIIATLGDMMKVPGSSESLSYVRAKGADIRFVYSPMDIIKIAKDNPNKKVIFFAIGFETTTPMSAVLVKEVVDKKIENLYFFINHITVFEPMQTLLDSKEAKIDAFIAPSNVSVITGYKMYESFTKKPYNRPTVVAGFEPVDVLIALEMIIKQFLENRVNLENQYKRSATENGNIIAKELIDKYFKKCDFNWRGLGVIPGSAIKLRDEFKYLDAEYIYRDILPDIKVEDNKACICGDILKGVAKPTDCKIFGTACNPTNPIGSCMVSSEGACSAYYKYGGVIS